QGGILTRERVQAVEVDVRDLEPPAAVDLADREGGARDGGRYSERADRPAHESRLAPAELTRPEHEVPPRPSRPHLGGRLLGLLRRSRLDSHPRKCGGPCGEPTCDRGSTPSRAWDSHRWWLSRWACSCPAWRPPQTASWPRPATTYPTPVL